MIELITKLYKRETEIICKGNTKKTLNFFNSLETRFSNISIGLSMTNVNPNSQKNQNNVVRVGDEYFRGFDRARDLGSHFYNSIFNGASNPEEGGRRRGNIRDWIMDLNPASFTRGNARRNLLRPHTRAGERENLSSIPNYISMLEQQIMQNLSDTRPLNVGRDEIEDLIGRNNPEQMMFQSPRRNQNALATSNEPRSARLNNLLSNNSTINNERRNMEDDILNHCTVIEVADRDSDRRPADMPPSNTVTNNNQSGPDTVNTNNNQNISQNANQNTMIFDRNAENLTIGGPTRNFNTYPNTRIHTVQHSSNHTVQNSNNISGNHSRNNTMMNMAIPENMNQVT